MLFHLSCGFKRDSDGRLTMDPSKCIEKMMTAHDQLFDGEKVTTKHKSPLDDNDHPELDPT